jgi:hypothetical protein
MNMVHSPSQRLPNSAGHLPVWQSLRGTLLIFATSTGTATKKLLSCSRSCRLVISRTQCTPTTSLGVSKSFRAAMAGMLLSGLPLMASAKADLSPTQIIAQDWAEFDEGVAIPALFPETTGGFKQIKNKKAARSHHFYTRVRVKGVWQHRGKPDKHLQEPAKRKTK